MPNISGVTAPCNVKNHVSNYDKNSLEMKIAPFCARYWLFEEHFR
jgi:hypothetical protein